jgi:hypothetical protein
MARPPGRTLEAQPLKHVAICLRIEVTEALRHHDHSVKGRGLRSVVANVGFNVSDSAAQISRFCDHIRVTIEPGDAITKAGERFGVSARAAAYIGNFAKIWQRQTVADESDFFGRARRWNRIVKQFKPLARIMIWCRLHNRRSITRSAFELAFVLRGVEVAARFRDQADIVNLPQLVAADPNVISRSCVRAG